jgi:putative endonuclease
MKPLGTHNYFVYIITNSNRKVLYTGMTDHLVRRLFEHKEDSFDAKKHFAGKYNCYYLLYWERFDWVDHAIVREKQIKGWTRAKKDALINDFNPNWVFLNDTIE